MAIFTIEYYRPRQILIGIDLIFLGTLQCCPCFANRCMASVKTHRYWIEDAPPRTRKLLQGSYCYPQPFPLLCFRTDIRRPSWGTKNTRIQA